MTQQTDLQRSLDQASVLMSTLDPSEWPGWVDYLLNCLGRQCTAEQFQKALEDLRDGLAGRIPGGR